MIEYRYTPELQKNSAYLKGGDTMAEGMSSKEATLRELEDEARKDLGITNIGPNMTTEEAGKLGGYMVKKLIERGERAMSEESHK
jgi:hypothetical protein